MLARTLPLILLLACGGKDPVIAPPTGTGTGAGTGTGTGTGGGSENCTNGTDDDGDGLLDCEDEDCANSPDCVETACDDGIDNDGDGAIDCADGDCWGNGCAVAQSQITAAGRVTWKEANLDFNNPIGASCSSYHLDTATITIESPVGTLRYLDPTGVETNCNWSATKSWVLDVNPLNEHFDNPRLLLRSGFTIDAGCPLQDPVFMPLVLGMDRTATSSDMWAMRTGAAGNGPPWFGWQGQLTLLDSTAVNQYNVGSCQHDITGQRQTVSWAAADVGFDFLIAAPDFDLPAGTTTP